MNGVGGATLASNGSVTSSNMRLSLASNTSFVDFLGTGNLTGYIGYRLVLSDPSGDNLTGYIKEAGTGETYSGELVPNGDFEIGDPLENWTNSPGVILNKVADPRPGSSGSYALQSIKNTTSILNFNADQDFISPDYGSLIYYDYWRKNINQSAGAVLLVLGLYGGSYSTNTIWNNAIGYKTLPSTGTKRLHLNGGSVLGGIVEFDDVSMKQILTPSITGVTIVSSSAGDLVYDWYSEDSGFDRNSATYNYWIYENDGGDPEVAISNPDIQTVNNDSLFIYGTASDNVGMTECKYRIGSAPDDSNGAVLNGTDSWNGTVSGFSYENNSIYVGCKDATDNWGFDNITVTYYPLNSYYVKNGGNDSLDGLSDETAWATIEKVEATILYGDTIYFRSNDTWESIGSYARMLTAVAGVTYDGSTYGNGTRAILKPIEDQSVMELGVVDLSESNVTFMGFEIDGNQKVTEGITVGHHATKHISNIIIDNVVVHDNGDPENDGWLYGILVSSTLGTGTVVYNVSITNCHLYNNGHEGIAIYESRLYPNNRVEKVLIRNCTVHDTGTTSDGSGMGILIANDVDNVTVEYCNLYNNDRNIWIRTSPIYEIPEGNGAPNNIIIRNNYLHDGKGTGISIINPQGSNPTSPVGISGDFYGNTIIDSALWGCSGSDGWGLSISEAHWEDSILNFYDNIFYDTLTNCSNSEGVIAIERWNSNSGFGGSPIFNFTNNIVFAGDFVPFWDTSARAIHSENLIYRSSDVLDTVIYTINYSSTLPNSTVTVSNDTDYVYFDKSDAINWSDYFSINNYVKWDGFSESDLNNPFKIVDVSDDQLKISNKNNNHTGTDLVSVEKWLTAQFNRSEILEWDSSASVLDLSYINSSSDFYLLWNSPAIDVGRNIDLSTDYLGNPIYGTPDIGAYEYQPPYNISTDVVEENGTIRIYSDGKYRRLNQTGAFSKTFIVQPVSGYPSHSSTEKRNASYDVELQNWTTSLMNFNITNLSASGAVDLTVCNLTANYNYSLFIDSTDSATYLSDSSGCVSFEYSGPWSEHEFELQRDAVSVAEDSESPSSGGGTSVYHPTELNLKEGYSKALGKNWRVKFTVEGENHELKIEEIDEDSVTITVFSNPQTKEMKVGEEWMVELTGDDVYDLLVVLDSIIGSRAIITVKSINEEILEKVTSIEEKTEEKLVEEGTGERVMDYWYLVWIGIVVALIILFLFYRKTRGKKKRFGFHIFGKK